MIKRHNIVLISVAASISAGIWITSFNKAPKKKISFSARVYEGSAGWGYDILADDSLFIHQEYIPVIAGKKGFDKKDEAKQAAKLVLQKLQQNQLPTLTTFDLKQIFSPTNKK